MYSDLFTVTEYSNNNSENVLNVYQDLTQGKLE